MPTTAADRPPAPRRQRGALQWPATPAGPRLRRTLAFCVLALLVGLLHGALLRGPGQAVGPPARKAPELAQPVHVVLAVAPRAAELALAADAALPARALPAPPPGRETRPAKRPTADAQPARSPTPPAPSPETPPPVVALAPPAAPASETAAATGTAPPGLAAAASSAGQAAPPEGAAPPVYPTEIPLSRTLDYRVARGAASGSGQLRWEATPSAYTLSLQASAPGGPALDWLSRGGFDSAGLAPQRMVERQRGRDMHAVNFQRDKQLISFSGPGHAAALLRGAQDRLSWLIQLGAVAQARPDTLKEGDALLLQVASPRGDVDEWRFTVGPPELLELAGSRWAALKLVREPQRPYDQRVEVWLAPGAGHLPLGLTLTTVPGGVPLELRLSGGLAPPP